MRGKVTHGVELPLDALDLKTTLEANRSSYVGKLPEWLRSQSGMTNENLFRHLDELADHLRQHPDKADQHSEPSAMTSLLQGALEEGGFSRVYKLGKEPHACALKVFSEPSDDLLRNYPFNSPYQEAANGLFFLGHDITADIVVFYAANPAKAWVLMELVTPSTQGRGRSLSDAGLQISDDQEKNRIGVKRIDLGGVVWAASMSRFMPIEDDPISEMV